jgi:hypothetical protein
MNSVSRPNKISDSFYWKWDRVRTLTQYLNQAGQWGYDPAYIISMRKVTKELYYLLKEINHV